MQLHTAVPPTSAQTPRFGCVQGLGEQATTGTQGALPHEVRVAGLRQWALEAFDGAVSCGVFEDGSVRCAGRNAGGHFGAATLTGGQSATLVAVPGITNARAVALGRRFACAVRDDAQLWCWGPANNPLMAGAGTAPTRVLDRVTRVAIANTATCALRDDGTVWCWGAGALVGNGGSDFVPAPVAVAGLTGVRGLYAGVTTVCAWRGGSDLRCWGSELTVAGEGATTPTPVVW